EYIWIAPKIGADPFEMRSKARVLSLSDKPRLRDFPEWSFDGSSTEQATGDNSDCILKPAAFVKDPIRGDGNYLVLCEVYDAEGELPHETNTRAKLRNIMENGGEAQEPWAGFEQEYTFLIGGTDIPLGWPEDGSEPSMGQGPYYCGVGAKKIAGRDIVEDHARLCLDAGIMFYGINAEVMLGQWEFQIGFRGDIGDDPGVLNAADHVWLGRWLLERVAEEYGVDVSFANKPIKGDWNGAGMHTNFSTNDTRDKSKGRAAIDAATAKLGEKHAEHVVLYGEGNDERLTGDHETCDINTFKVGDADRGCSIRIPKPVAIKGYGYFEDRRPGANADPYLVAAKITATVLDIDDSVLKDDTAPVAKAA
ncbi:MAG: glutamine synthetase beta-grasp domain-containing protein, partial [Pseudomonadota bacterium]